MKEDTAERVRAEMRDYMETAGLNITEFAKALKPEGPSARASVGKFLRGQQSDLRGGMMQRFRDLQRNINEVRENTALYNQEHDDPWVGIALELRDLVGFLEDETIPPDRKLKRFQETVGHYFRLLVAFNSGVANSTKQ